MRERTRLIVIGGGVAGYSAALRAARVGAEVTLIEKDTLGGTCLNRGCIPTKVYLQAADTIRSIRGAATFGVATDGLDFDFRLLKQRKDQTVARLLRGVKALLKAKEIRIIQGSAQLDDEKTVSVLETGEKLAADRVVIATGSSTVRPSIEGVDSPAVWTSDDCFAAEELPKSIGIIGGGVVGVEFACFFHGVGVQTTVIEAKPGILPGFDREAAGTLEDIMRRLGISIVISASVISLEQQGEGVVTHYRDAKGIYRSLKTERILLCVGRKPFWRGLGLERLGIATEGDAIRANGRMESNIPGIFAAGDVTGGPMLAHLAAAQGECAAFNALDGAADLSGRAVPYCVYAFPELAAVGLTEEEAAQRFGAVAVGRFPLRANGKAHVLGETEGFFKVVAHREQGRLLGVHILAPHATEMIAAATLALTAGLTVRQAAETIHPHPTLSEALMEAAMSIAGGAVHLP